MDDTIYVHPSRLVANPGKGVNPVGDEEITSGAYLRSMETISAIERIREYLPGDPLHRIYWKGVITSYSIHYTKLYESC